MRKIERTNSASTPQCGSLVKRTIDRVAAPAALLTEGLATPSADGRPAEAQTLSSIGGRASPRSAGSYSRSSVTAPTPNSAFDEFQ